VQEQRVSGNFFSVLGERDLYQRAARDGRYVLFTVDQ